MSELSAHRKAHPTPQAKDSSTRPAVAWQPKRELEKREWVVVGKRLGGISRCNQWWLGDWVRYGTQKWGEKYTQAAKITGYDPRSLANMASIAAAFDLSRRRDDLTWSHHVAVAALPDVEQSLWLERAASEKLSVADLRTELRAAQKGIKAGDDADQNSEVDDDAEVSIACPNCGHRLSPRECGFALVEGRP
jgi:hypothetical protein